MTIKEIAKLSGVGTSTVSRYLNSGYVSQKNRIKIQEVIDKNNYVPNSNARNLKFGSNKVNVILPRLASYTASRFMAGVIDECNEHNLEPTFHSSEFNYEKQEKLISEFSKSKDYGVIINSFQEEKNKYIDTLKIVYTGQNSHFYPYIYTSGKYKIAEMANYIIEQFDINKIVYIGINDIDPEMIKRYKAVQKVASDKEIDFDFVYSGFDSEFKFEIDKGVFYICMSDKIAYKAYRIANEKGFVLGKDIYLSGFGDYEYSELLEITSIYQNPYKIGADSVRLLVEYDNENFEVETIIKYRKSTGQL